MKAEIVKAKTQKNELQKNALNTKKVENEIPQSNQKNDLSCEVVQDLLPSYLDKLTNDVTNKAIERHLNGCEKCTEKMQRMQKANYTINNEIPEKEIDFLKILKKNTKKKIFLSITAMLVAILFIIGLKLFVIGDELSSQEISCNIDATSDGDVYLYDIVCLSSGKNLTNISYKEENYELYITFNGVLASPLSSHRELQTTYLSENKLLSRIYIGDTIVWDGGQNISPVISALYKSRHEFVGNMAANEKTLQALRIQDVLGDFENELLTSEEPYGWKIILKSDIHTSDSKEMEKYMKRYATLLMATIGNLEYVTFEYNIETYLSGTKPQTLTITTEDAIKLFDLHFYAPVFDENGSIVGLEDNGTWEEHEWTPAELQNIMYTYPRPWR